MDISVIGLGKLGAPLAACMASKGFNVTGIDLNQDFVNLINMGKAPVVETGLPELIRKVHPRLNATEDYETAILKTQVTFIIVPTPTDRYGGFTIKYVLGSISAIGKALRKKKAYHLIVLTSTVLPGSMDKYILPALEKSSGKRCGKDFGLCYNPEFIALGSVIRDMLNPDLLLIGESDKRAGEMLEGIYRNFCDSKPHIARMNFVNAELSKLAVNTFITTKISYANMLAEICEKLPGGDVDAVTSAVGSDSRIGRKYLKGALGYGGPCFPRDNIAFSYLARKVGAHALIAQATDRLNDTQVPRVYKLILNNLPQKGTVGILGLSYKTETNVVDESQGIKLAQYLAGEGIPVIVYDPQAMENAKAVLGKKVQYAGTMADCLRKADVAVITTPWPEFSNIKPSQIKKNKRQAVIIDCWRILDPVAFKVTAKVIGVGRG